MKTTFCVVLCCLRKHDPQGLSQDRIAYVWPVDLEHSEGKLVLFAKAMVFGAAATSAACMTDFRLNAERHLGQNCMQQHLISASCNVHQVQVVSFSSPMLTLSWRLLRFRWRRCARTHQFGQCLLKFTVQRVNDSDVSISDYKTALVLYIGHACPLAEKKLTHPDSNPTCYLETPAVCGGARHSEQ